MTADVAISNHHHHRHDLHRHTLGKNSVSDLSSSTINNPPERYVDGDKDMISTRCIDYTELQVVILESKGIRDEEGDNKLLKQ